MAEQMRPSSPQQAPNPAHSYERSDPNRESGMGRMENIGIAIGLGLDALAQGSGGLAA